MEIIVNQDIRKFKTKDVGNFSFKELAFIIAAAVPGYGVYYIEKNIMAMEQIEVLPIVLVAAVPLAFGFAKPQGMTFMQFLKTVVRENFVEPKLYYWESDFEPDSDEFADLYGEDYALTEDRIEQIREMSGTSEKGKHIKRTKEQIRHEKEMMIL